MAVAMLPTTDTSSSSSAARSRQSRSTQPPSAQDSKGQVARSRPRSKNRRTKRLHHSDHEQDMPTSIPSSAEGGPSREGRDTNRRKLGLQTQKLKQMNQHHPYRIELLDVTPLSVSLLWSIRPPPLSAIPQSIVNTPLKQRFSARTLSNGPSGMSTSATASAVAASPSTSVAVSSRSAKGPNRHAQQSLDAPSAHEPPIHKLAEGLVATRSLNRKVTKIRLKGPPSASIITQNRRTSNGSSTPDSLRRLQEEERWPPDDGATLVEDGSASDGSDSGFEGEPKSASMVNVFEDRVSVVVNGHDWPHVLIGERGAHEAIVVIFGLEPESDYDVQFEVKDCLGGSHEAIRASLRTITDRDHIRNGNVSSNSKHIVSAVKGSAVATARSASPSPLSKTAPDTDADDLAREKKAVLQAEYDASESIKAELLAELRKVRKETSKAESNLRNEIEAVKRGIDRMSATDHRSKQKVLALQETIKQTTVHVKEIHDEAQIVEDGRQEWEEMEMAVITELEELRQQVEAEEREVNAQLAADDEAVAALEKVLKAAEADLKSKEDEMDAIKDDKLPGIKAEIEKLRAQIKDASMRSMQPRRGGHQTNRHVSGPSQLVLSQTLPRQKGTHGLGHPSAGGRGGGKFAQTHSARASSGPASQGAFQGPFKPFVPGGSGGRSYRAGPPGLTFPPQAWTNLFDPTSTEVPFRPGFSSMGHTDALYGLPQFGNSAFGQAPSFDYAQDGSSSSPTGSERRSSLPLPQLFGKPSSLVLNPYKPEFIPAAASANASPVMAKGSLQGGRPGGLAPPAVSSPPAGIASVEHSPTASSRFAFPLARHNAGPISKTTPGNGVPSPIGSDRQAAALATTSLGSTTSQLFPPGVGSGSRASPLLAGASASGSSVSSLMFSINSPRFGPSALADEGGSSVDAGFGKFGPLDYDPSMNDFGPAPHTIFGCAPFNSSALPSLFGSSDTWAAPGAPTTSSLGNGGSSQHNSTWVASSPPLGSNDIWSAPTLPGVRTKLSLGNMARGYGGRSALGQDLPGRNGSRFMNISAPVSPTSPTSPENRTQPLREEAVEEASEPPSSTDGNDD